jgi:outer membrane protein OmpA-like peptidoglycan-associated protein
MMAANREGSIELSVGASILTVDQALNGGLAAATIADPDPSRIMFGGTARVGYNLNRNLGFSAGSGFFTGNGATAIAPFAAVTYTFDLNRQWSPFITAGGQLTRFSGNGIHVTAEYGGHGGVGIRYFFQDNLALRVEGRMAYESYAETPDPAYNGVASAGVSYLIGGGPPRDTDGDGVPDRRDRCANTPRGATVDARGCPSDTDNDGVYNGLDRCPDTPRGTPVDASGCTRDSDRDGIADNLDRCPNTPSGVRVDASGCPVDTDRDGVPDHLDRCADTPAGVPVDANGCPRDSDGDGVTDNNDRCPDTPAGTPVDANGCPRDSDGDGVTDNNDRCPNTAAGTQVDANGCPVQRDADGDGVIDANDRCPNTPAGRRVDANGCELAELPTEVGRTLVLRNITFSAGTSRLAPTARPILDGIATSINSFLQANASASFEIGGHTDNRGSPAANTRLSQARAQAVLDYLVSRGVPRDKLRAVGYGPGQPVAPNTTAAGRAQNRRVEIKRVQ